MKTIETNHLYDAHIIYDNLLTFVSRVEIFSDESVEIVKNSIDKLILEASTIPEETFFKEAKKYIEEMRK